MSQTCPFFRKGGYDIEQQQRNLPVKADVLGSYRDVPVFDGGNQLMHLYVEGLCTALKDIVAVTRKCCRELCLNSDGTYPVCSRFQQRPEDGGGQ